jgi:hypothetical protein
MADITIVYSGGSQNVSPDNSLGGFPAGAEVTDKVNNLFPNIESKQTTIGQTDYKCFYIFNDNIHLKYQVTLYIDYLSNEGTTLTVGLLFQNEIQTLRFVGSPTGGTFQISVQGLVTEAISWNSDNTILAASIKTALDNKFGNSTVTVSGTNTFTITFLGDLQNKALSNMALSNNQITPLGTVTEQVSRVQFGSPINTIAPDTGSTKMTPNGVPFLSILSPGIVVGSLYPSEGFPVWIKRVLPPESIAVETDGFKLQLKTIGTILE